MIRLAILSDTHSLLRPQVLEVAAGADRILHAGDVGDAEILHRLAEVAPVEAVRGNTDHGPIGRLPEVVSGSVDGIAYRMTHHREDVPAGWVREARLIIFGHSHRPELSWRGGCLLLNPGAVGPRRFKLPLTMAIITLCDGRMTPEIVAVE